MKLSARNGLPAVVMFILSSIPGWAQSSMSLSGVVVDPLGWTVSGVEVFTRESNTSRTRKARTDEVGRYEFRELPLGEYVVQGSKPGFRQRAESLTLRDANVRLDLMLELEAAAEEITVWGTKPDEGLVGATRRGKRGRAPECSPKVVAARQGGIIQLPRKVVHVAPAYTKEAHAFGPLGRVQVQGTIAADGRMSGLRATTATDLVFVKPVLDAVSLWEFEPKYLNCMAVETNLQVTVNFSHAAPR